MMHPMIRITIQQIRHPEMASSIFLLNTVIITKCTPLVKATFPPNIILYRNESFLERLDLSVLSVMLTEYV